MQVAYTFYYATELSSCTVQQRPDKTRLQTVLSIIQPSTSLSDLSSCTAVWHFWVSSQAFLCPYRESFKQPPCSPGALSKLIDEEGQCGTVWQELWFLSFQYSWSEAFQHWRWKMLVHRKICCARDTFGLGISLSPCPIPLFSSVLLD